MRKIMSLIIFVMVLLLSRLIYATPFYSTFFQDPSHPIISAGSYNDLLGQKVPKAGSALALVYHNDPAPSTAIKALYAQHALTIGGGAGDGSVFGGIGVVVNMLPVSKYAVLSGLKLITKDDQLTNVKDLLAPPKTGSIDLTIACGPQFTFNMVEGGALLSPDRWKGDPRLFTGAQLLFGGIKK